MGYIKNTTIFSSLAVQILEITLNVIIMNIFIHKYISQF